MVVLTEIVLPLVALDSITAASVLLAIVGTLYLAYDLLGRQHGPLQWLTLIITCGLVNALVLGFVSTTFYSLLKQHFNFNYTLQSLVIRWVDGRFHGHLSRLPQISGKAADRFPQRKCYWTYTWASLLLHRFVCSQRRCA